MIPLFFNQPRRRENGEASRRQGETCAWLRLFEGRQVSPAQVRARAKKAKEITDGKKKKQQDNATAVSLAKKAAKVQRRAEADSMERERYYRRY
ncbi:MAG: hypothetical protein KBB77_02285 [Candidatus Moranbacteria bacterium]|nr:hypothetical protein [Candidatus Moranbacteria bacterium]